MVKHWPTRKRKKEPLVLKWKPPLLSEFPVDVIWRLRANTSVKGSVVFSGANRRLRKLIFKDEDAWYCMSRFIVMQFLIFVGSFSFRRFLFKANWGHKYELNETTQVSHSDILYMKLT